MYIFRLYFYTTFNCNSTNEDKAFKVTLELPIVMPNLILEKPNREGTTWLSLI